MRGLARAGVLLAAIASAAGAWGQTPEPAVVLIFASPPATQAAFGAVSVEVEVFADVEVEVVLRVDEREVGRLTGPPWRLEVELGDDFRSHRFEAIALVDGVEVARDERVTPGLRVDDAIDLELQQLYVTVDGSASGHRLLASHFQIDDNGQPQEVVTFEGGDAALTVALLVDASASMRGRRLEAALEGVRAFMSGMKVLDEAAVYLFSDLLRYRSPFTQDPDRLHADLASIEAGGGTAVNDALYAAIRQLERRQGRRVVVLLSDGVDIHSALRAEDVRWAMERSRSLVYWIELAGSERGARMLSAWRDADRHAEEIAGLRRLVEDSGGRVLSIETTEQAAEALGEILRELRRQYVLGYYPTVNLGDGRWHRVRVRSTVPGLELRTRGGYVDY